MDLLFRKQTDLTQLVMEWTVSPLRSCSTI